MTMNVISFSNNKFGQNENVFHTMKRYKSKLSQTVKKKITKILTN